MGALQCNVRDNTVAAVVAALGTFGKDDAAPAGSSPLSALSPTPTLLYHIAISNPSIRLHDADAAERRHMALWLGSFLAQNSISVEADQVTERIELSLEHTAAQIHNPDQQAVPEVLFAETQIDMNVKRVSARKGVLLSTEVGVLVHDIAIVVSPDHLAYLKRLPVLLDGILQAPTPPPTSARRASLAPVTPARRSRVHAATTAMQPASFAVSALFGNLTASLLYADGEKLCDVVLETPEVTYKDDSLKGLHFGCNVRNIHSWYLISHTDTSIGKVAGHPGQPRRCGAEANEADWPVRGRRAGGGPPVYADVHAPQDGCRERTRTIYLYIL